MVFKFSIFHFRMVLKNNTTLEILDAERKNSIPIEDYNLGIKRNWDSVFGPGIIGWFLPLPNTKMTSDGIIWMKKENLY